MVTGDNMQTELDNKYLVLKWDDINNVLNNSETRKLAMMLKKIGLARAKESKVVDKEYVIVSENSPAYEETYQATIDWINGVPYESTNAKIYKAVEAALIAEREKIKKLIPHERVIIIPDPEEPDEEEISTKAVKIAETMITGGKVIPMSKRMGERPELTAVEKAKEVVAKGKKNAKNKS